MENASKALIIAGAILISILLITIGIILINSGRDVVDTGTSGMASQRIQTFNSQFTPYEGAKKGSEIRNLGSVVRANNVADEGHQVAVYINGAKTAGGESAKSLTDLATTKTYKVELEYANSDINTYALDGAQGVIVPTTYNNEDGYIYRITISENS